MQIQVGRYSIRNQVIYSFLRKHTEDLPSNANQHGWPQQRQQQQYCYNIYGSTQWQRRKHCLSSSRRSNTRLIYREWSNISMQNKKWNWLEINYYKLRGGSCLIMCVRTWRRKPEVNRWSRRLSSPENHAPQVTPLVVLGMARLHV